MQGPESSTYLAPTPLSADPQYARIGMYSAGPAMATGPDAYAEVADGSSVA